MWLIAAQGAHTDYVVDLVADSRVRLRYRRRWHTATATVRDLEPEIVASFNPHARGVLRLGIDAKLVRVDYSSTVT